ncbi:MAG: hypothetical protein AB1656_24630 [Candidatus Omnitrophota bacterium]
MDKKAAVKIRATPDPLMAPGVYPAECLGVELFQGYFRFRFRILHPEFNTLTVSGLCPSELSPQSKLNDWIQALTHKELLAGEKLDL